MGLNIPNTITMVRICLVPVLVVVFYLPFPNHLLVAAGIFGVAAATDWVDGYLARRLGQMTEFGAFLDPVADKLMVSIALVLLVERHTVHLGCLRDYWQGNCYFRPARVDGRIGRADFGGRVVCR
jgi:CDP-diacylglycerol--glycerol-3-phosphate 3-phosphatidyltransferase